MVELVIVRLPLSLTTISPFVVAEFAFNETPSRVIVPLLKLLNPPVSMSEEEPLVLLEISESLIVTVPPLF